MSDWNLEELVESYINGSLSDTELDKLNHRLETSKQDRSRFRELLTVHEALSDVYSDRDPILPLASPVPQGASMPATLMIPIVAGLCVISLLGVAASIWLHSKSNSAASLAQIISSDSLPVGPAPKGVISIDSGFAELEMTSGARFAIEGGTSIKLLNGNKIRLISGSIGAQVPERARGFTVETRHGDIVDLGTSFGVTIDPLTDNAESELFNGEIEIHAGSRIENFKGQAVIALSGRGNAIEHLGSQVKPLRFPMPKRIEIIPVARGDFEPGDDYEIMDSELAGLGNWGGNYARIVSQSPGVRPYQGKGMLQLVSSGPEAEASDRWFCDVVQWVDLSAYLLEGAKITATAKVNRVEGDEKTDTEFKLFLSAHKSLKSGKLNEWSTNQIADSDSSTWENLEVRGALLPGTRYIKLRVGAVENTKNNRQPGEVEFDGHFIDQVELKLILPARHSVR